MCGGKILIYGRERSEMSRCNASEHSNVIGCRGRVAGGICAELRVPVTVADARAA